MKAPVASLVFSAAERVILAAAAGVGGEAAKTGLALEVTRTIMQKHLR